MTEQYCALTVVLEKNVRVDDAQFIIEAIQMIKGVLEVKTCVADLMTFVAEERARSELKLKLLKALYSEEVLDV